MKALLIALCFLVTSCAHDSDKYRDRLPAFHFNDFFTGDLCAKGLVKARNGEVNRKFVASIHAKSSEQKVTLDEVFVFDDGEIQTRFWQFEKRNDGWYGSAGDVIDTAFGQSFGDSFNLTYQLEILIDGEHYIISMDDWLHQIDNTTLMGTTQMTKWGVNVGRIDIVIQKSARQNNVTQSNIIEMQSDKSSLIQNTTVNVNHCIDNNYSSIKS